MLASNARFGIATSPTSPKLAASVLQQLARLHGGLWNAPELKHSPTLTAGGKVLSQFVDAYLYNPENWECCLDLPCMGFADFPVIRNSNLRPFQQPILSEL